MERMRENELPDGTELAGLKIIVARKDQAKNLRKTFIYDSKKLAGGE